MALGFPNSLYEEIFGDGPRAIIAPNPYKTDTALFAELALIAEFAGGSIRGWRKRSVAERRMWLYYKLLTNEKIRQQHEDARQEAENRNRTKSNLSTVTVDRPGIRK